MPVAELSLESLRGWGEALGARIDAPQVVTLSGDLGAGKTTLAQSICLGYGVTDAVTSPTFALVHEYRAERSPVYHLDLYRLPHPRELANIGWDDVMASRALVLVEWPEVAASDLPSSRMALTLEHVRDDPGRRRLSW